jgi:hypothetical protein
LTSRFSIFCNIVHWPKIHKDKFMLSPVHLFRLKFRLALLLGTSLWLGLGWTALPVYAQGPLVTTTEPTKNAANVEATTSISVTFDTEIDSITVSTDGDGSGGGADFKHHR